MASPFVKACQCHGRYRTISELLFEGPPKFYNGEPMVVFTCRVLSTCEQSSGGDNISDVEVETVYFGSLSAKRVSLNTGSPNSSCNGWTFQAGIRIIVFTSGSGPLYYCGGSCDSYTRQILVDSLKPQFKIYAIHQREELAMLDQFKAIYASKPTLDYHLTGYKNLPLAEGRYVNGKPVGIWKHYAQYDQHNGWPNIPNVKYDFDSLTLTEYNTESNSRKQSHPGLPSMISTTYYADSIGGRMLLKKTIKWEARGLNQITQTFFADGKPKKWEELAYDTVLTGGYYPVGRINHYRLYSEDGHHSLEDGRYKGRAELLATPNPKPEGIRTGRWSLYDKGSKTRKEIAYP